MEIALLYLLGSILYAIPASLSAYYSRKSALQLKTSNGKTVGQIVEDSHKQNSVLLRRSTDVKHQEKT